MTVRVMIVDDQPLVRAGFHMLVSSQPDMTVVGEAGDGAQAIAAVDRLRGQGEPPDVVVMDIRMPVMDGVTATRALCGGAVAEPVATGPGSAVAGQGAGLGAARPPKVIVLTTFDTDAEAFASLRAGASGFLLKDAPPEELLAAIRTVAAGDAVVAPKITRRLLDRFATTFVTEAATPAADPLTDRERDVCLLIAQGLSNAEIARQLSVAEATVKSHVGHILAKLRLRDRVQIVIYAYEHGLVRPAT